MYGHYIYWLIESLTANLPDITTQGCVQCCRFISDRKCKSNWKMIFWIVGSGSSTDYWYTGSGPQETYWNLVFNSFTSRQFRCQQSQDLLTSIPMMTIWIVSYTVTDL